MPFVRSSWRRLNGDRRFRRAVPESQSNAVVIGPQASVDGHSDTPSACRVNVLSTPSDETGRGVDLATVRMEDVHLLPSVTIRRLIHETFEPENASKQFDIIRGALQKFLGDRGLPREQQVRAVRRLVYGWGDTILVAKTSFGKSLVIHSFSALTSMITIQIIPLIKLGEEQLATIRRLPFCKPCLVDADTKLNDPRLLDDIRRGVYTHILIGPEQIASPEFRALLSDGTFRDRIGLVAIDECHLVSEWSGFRSDYTLVGELRRMLPSRVRWFGCTATMDSNTEQRVKRFGGFHDENLEVIRTSIDRPEISVCVIPIPRGKLRNFDMLYFLLKSASQPLQSRGSQLEATPADIPKTVIFVDNVNQIIELRSCLVNWLMQLGYTPQLARQTVEAYYSDLADIDKDRIISAFASTVSSIRILVSTSGMGMGMDIPDVQIVLQWKFTIGDSILDTWQRFGRAVRRPGFRGHAILMIPYWAFDHLGVYPAGYAPSKGSSSRGLDKAKKHRNMTRADRRDAKQSQSQTWELGNMSATLDSAASDCSQASQQSRQRGKKKGQYTWTMADIKHRDGLSPEWMKLCRSTCYREFFLDFLQESEADPATRQERPTQSCCCNGSACNPDLFPGTIVGPPQQCRKQGKPKPNSQSGFALERIEAWCRSQAARDIESVDDEVVSRPAWSFMSEPLQWSMARVFDQPYASVADFQSKTVDDLGEATGLVEWEHWPWFQDDIHTFLQSILEPVRQEYGALLIRRQEKRTAKRLSQMMAGQPAGPSRTTEPTRPSQREADDARGFHVALLQKQAANQAYPPSPLSTGTPLTQASRIEMSNHPSNGTIDVCLPCVDGSTTGDTPNTQRAVPSMASSTPDPSTPSPAMTVAPAVPSRQVMKRKRSSVQLAPSSKARVPLAPVTTNSMRSRLGQDRTQQGRSNPRPAREARPTEKARESGIWR